MGDLYIAETFSKILQDSEFKRRYLLSFLDKFVYSTVDLEKQLSSIQRKQAIESLLTAFNYLMDMPYDKMGPTDIKAVGDIINESDGIAGLRRVEVNAGVYANWTPVPASQIYYNLYSLLSNYYEVWSDRNIYEKEAAFHISLMRIHPLEDGNKRTAKIIMNANFVKQNSPPVVITEGETELYYQFINNQDIEGFAKFLKEKSLQELRTLISFYKVEKNIPITDSLVDTIPASGGRK